MISYIDEAGSFVIKGARKNSWCTVACYSSPEFEKRKYIEILRQLKVKEIYTPDCELKLRNVSESGYINFLSQLGELQGSLFCVATDSFHNSIDRVNAHRDWHLTSIVQGRGEMKYAGGKKAADILHSQLYDLPEQLYIQFHCQAVLLSTFIRRGVAYYIQRFPNALKCFRWQYDSKEISKITNFEDSFQKFVPALLQAYSIDNPAFALDWCDYSPMKRYMGKIPDYLADKVPEIEGEEGFDVQKIIREDTQFLDSKYNPGIQIADLLASGVRRLLRLEFNYNELVAKKLGMIMIQDEENKAPVSLVSFDGEFPVDKELSKIIKIMIKNCRRLLK